MGDTAVEKRISPHNMEKKDSAYKRSNKPFMEKKRRARINNCLGQLKTLVLQAMRKDTNQYSKLEKADILEMTVKHLRQLQRQHVTQAISHDPTVATKYKAGFNECANEVVRYLSNVHGVEDNVRSKLINHLGNVVSTVNHTENSHQPCQPLNVQIPQQVNQGLPSVPSGCLLMPAGVQASPLVIQQQVQNVSNSYTQGHNTQSLQQRNHGHQTQFCGSFQIVPNSSSPGAVAVYLGQTQNVPQNVQTSPVSSTNHAVPLYSTHTPPRTKASLKAFDSSAFSQVSGSTNSSPSCSPSSQESFLPSNLDLQIHGLDVKCGRTPSPLKMEDVWRPW